MPVEPKAPVAILWHMHQPEYRIGGLPLLPWAYLHSLRAYTDMASHLEAVPGTRVVVNFSPVLLDQILDLAQQAQAAATGSAAPREPLMAALLVAPAAAQRRSLLETCLRGHERQADRRYEEYYRLAVEVSAALDAGDAAIAALPEATVADMVVWYHLIWLGESVRQADPRAQSLLRHRRDFGAEQRRDLLLLVAELLSGIVPRYRALAVSGRAELSMSPYFHPILPLLLDFRSALEATPGTPLPSAGYPDGRERAAWHLRQALERFWQIFGMRPRGCWPSEAAVSQETAALLQAEGFDWLASSQSVQKASAHRHSGAETAHSCAYRLSGKSLAAFFRDDSLSDNIGFVYKDWDPRHAVADLVGHLESLSQVRRGELIMLALDGENPWEYYPCNGIDFVRGLYSALTAHPRLRMATLADYLDEAPTLPELPGLAAGSWVHGQLLTWIGSTGKNQAWELLIEAKRCFDAATPAHQAAAQRELGACEGSDWFWWPGMPHPGAAVADFDRLFREHLKALYRALNLTAPAALDHALEFGGTAATPANPLGAMLPSR